MLRVIRLVALAPRPSFRSATLCASPMSRSPFAGYPTIPSARRLLATDSKPPTSFTSQPSSNPATPSPNDSKFKSLMKRYGAPAVAIYLGISAIDLTITFALLRQTGGDRIRDLEDWLFERMGGRYERREKTQEETKASEGGQPSFTTVFAIAYGIHKTILMPFRVGITAAITPAVVKTLQKRGWNLGKTIVDGMKKAK